MREAFETGETFLPGELWQWRPAGLESEKNWQLRLFKLANSYGPLIPMANTRSLHHISDSQLSENSKPWLPVCCLSQKNETSWGRQ